MRVPVRARDDRRGAAVRGRDALIVEYVRHLKSGDDEAKRGAAAALMRLADYDNYGIAAAVIRAGGVAPLVALLEDDDAAEKWHLIYTLRFIATERAGAAAVVAAGGVPRLVKLSQTLCTYGSAYAHTMWTLQHLADGDDAHWVAIAAAVSVEALAELARDGRVRVGRLRRDALWNAGAAIRGRAARALRSLFRACLGRAARAEVERAVVGFLLHSG
ncbi:hypothetical protein JL722_14850 [Aureococcus anophagefferens]|nr:hypothetical protein JL722_14850 [Aureococcus anophagefferens]